MIKRTDSKPTSLTTIGRAAIGRLFVLDVSGGRILSMSPDGSDQTVIVTGCRHPDGIVADVEAGNAYWTDMGVPNLNDGSIDGAAVEGRDGKPIRPKAGPLTP